MLLYVIANCHCLPLADILALGVRRGPTRVQTDFIDLVFMDFPHMRERIERLLTTDSDDPVFSFPVSSQFKQLGTTELRAILGSRLKIFSNIYFAGLHPDITYIGNIGNRHTSYFGDYHSKLIAFCYASGRSEQDCLALFNGQIYERVGFFSAYQDSADELVRRDEDCDIKFASDFLGMIKRGPCLYSSNHPTGGVFLELADRMATHVGIPFAKLPPFYAQNHLASNYIWPVYDEIAETHHLEYRVPQAFVHSSGEGSRLDDLSDFVAGFYDAYSRVEHEEFCKRIESLPFYPTFKEALD